MLDGRYAWRLQPTNSQRTKGIKGRFPMQRWITRIGMIALLLLHWGLLMLGGRALSLTADEAPTWLAQCNQPYAPLYDGAIQEGFGDLALRTFEFDCRHTWIYPDGEESRGAYALHADLLQPPTLRERLALRPSRPADPFTSRHLTLAQGI